MKGGIETGCDAKDPTQPLKHDMTWDSAAA